MPLIPLDNTLGSQLIGTIASSIIYGVTCMQVYLYYTEYSKKDGVFLRSYVAFIMILDTLHVAFVSHTTYVFTVKDFGNYFTLLHSPWSLASQVAIGHCLFVAFELFFAYRIFRLSQSRNWWIPAIIVILSLVAFAPGLAYTIKGLGIGIAKAREILLWACIGFSIEFVCDTITTCAMIYYLRRCRTQFKRTNRVVNMLSTYSLSTGLLVTVFTLVTLALTVVYSGDSLVYAPFYYTLVRLYSCSFMSTLNNREAVRSVLGGDGEVIMLSAMGTNTGSTGNGEAVHQVLDIKQRPSRV